MIRILIGDDHAIVRQGLRLVLTLMPELELVAEAKNGWEVIEQIRTCSPDLLLLDMNMPGPSGVELIKRVRAEAPAPPATSPRTASRKPWLPPSARLPAGRTTSSLPSPNACCSKPRRKRSPRRMRHCPTANTRSS